MSPALALLALLSCAGRLPSALRPDPPALASAETDAGPASWERLVGSDPLLRRPPAGLAWPEAAEFDAVRAFAEIAALSQPQPTDWRALERSFPASVAVPLARGALLADLEALVGGGIRPTDAAAVAALLLPLSDLDRTGPSDVRAPLAWASRAGQEATAADLLHFAERRVLLGWLDGPALPVAAAAQAMQPGVHDRLIASPAGAILIARAETRRDEEAGARGRAALQQATTLALHLVAAESDREQELARERLAQASALLPPPDADQAHERDRAIRLLLTQARVALVADAGSDESSGLALVASAAERIRGQCPDLPCGGLDRSAALARVSAWGPDAATQASLWQVILTRQAVVGLELNLERPTFHARLLDTVELLLGEEVDALPLSLLRQGAPGPSTWLAITRATGAPDATEAEHGLRALRDLLVRRCDRALALGLSSEDRALVERIKDRAEAPPPAPTP